MRTLRSLSLIAIVAAGAAHPALHALQESLASQPIEQGKTVEGALSGGQIARYALSLDAGHFATGLVVHRNIDVILRLQGTGAEPDVEWTSDGATGEVRLRLHATRTGLAAIEIAAAYPKSPPGSYTIRVDDVRPATAADQELWDADRHDSRARRLRSSSAYAAALSEAEQALALREKVLGRTSPEVARSLLLVAQLNDAMANFRGADGLYVRARAIASDGPELLKAAILDSYAANCIALGRFTDAEPLVKEAFAIRERILGSHHVLVAASLGTWVDLHHENSNFQDARIAAERAFDIAGRIYGAGDSALAEFRNRVARSQLALGNFARAGQLYSESLDVAEKRGGPESLAVADAVGGLARVALLTNDNVTSEQRHLRSLAIREKILAPDHPQIANDVFNLALIHYRRRDYASAHVLNSRALAIREKTLGRSHPVLALTFNNIGLVYWRQGDYRKAEEFYQRAFDLAEKLFGPDSLRVANSLGNLGVVAKESGNYALAETRYTRSLAIKEKHLGADHPDLIATVESLAILYRDRGDYTRAEEMLERTLRISSTSYGPDHPFIARHLGNLSLLYRATGKTERAMTALQRLNEINERYLALNLSIGSERQKLAYFEPRLRDLEETISFHVQESPNQPGARDLAITTLLQRKGRILDALADSVSAVRNRSQPDDRALLDQLTRVSSDLAAAVLSGSTQSPLAERQRVVAALAARREQLESDIQRRSAGYLEPSRPLSLEAVEKAVPADGALVEFAVYRPLNPRRAFETGEQFGTPRYVAYVIRHSGDIGWRDLGTAEEIDRIVDRFRTALADPAHADVIRQARELHQRLIAPLEGLFGNAAHLVISPDGSLNLIPFEALRSANGRYLVEDLSVSYVTTGRDLVRMLAPRPHANRDVVFANPAFGEPAVQQIARVSAATPAVRRRSVTAGQDLSSVYFAPVAGTASEAQRIRALFPDVELRSGAEATEKALKGVQAPRILHLATHGFFLENGGSPEARRSNDATRGLNARASIENPLLRSGLALAGANLQRTSGDDGILTAMEAANLNLWGTKLVTLSACDTGVGVVRNGEGVYGLRRAFFLAGAESLVMSLWPVSDLTTREMMTGYYAGLKSGLGRGTALRRMQLQMLKRKGRSHPFYWASFIQAGDWATLDGTR